MLSLHFAPTSCRPVRQVQPFTQLLQSHSLEAYSHPSSRKTQGGNLQHETSETAEMQTIPERSCQAENVCESGTVSEEMMQQPDSCLGHEFTLTHRT